MLADVPGQRILNAIDGMPGIALQRRAQIGLGIKAVEFGGADEAVNGSRTFATRIRSGKQVVLPP